ncbi:1-acyl-sn-glycerol-3-phosphate acyltransferase [Longispora albida]|uniref:lysophospholipid acyltransferase family protein n=1 Tax=Longispora albida TaxID=203523 RepID=UPI000477EFC7
MGFWRRAAVSVVKPPLLAFTRRTWRGMEHIPASGGAILAVNHISHADPFGLAHYVYDAGRWPQLLGKASLFHLKVIGPWLKAVGQIPVYRGTADASKSLSAAEAAIDRGEIVIIYPEGTVSKEPSHWPMRGKTGVARLALITGAPVIPIAQWGAQKMFDPLTKKVGLRFRNHLSVVAGPPVDLSPWRDKPLTATVLQEVTDEIMYAIRDLLAEIRGEEAPELYSPGSRHDTNPDSPEGSA